MKKKDRAIPIYRDLDDLRLLALSRIPRCKTCGRLRALREARRRGDRLHGRLPAVPAGCSTPYCAPLATRYERRSSAAKNDPGAVCCAAR
jgi:hypothetical protein